ncbi:hypothetical protein BSKO_01646 [Bryopsis sp. KO-2023]|nr:hypothetical protein BSKO_01646 [Bryopsis sp. KO-2023]
MRKKRLWSHLRESSIDADPATKKRAPSRRTRLKKRGLPSIDEDSAGVFAADITGFGDGTQFSTPDGVATSGQIGGSSNSVGVVRASASLDGVKKNTLDGGATSGQIGGSSSNGVVQRAVVQVSTSHGGAKSGQIGGSSNSVGVVRASASLDGVKKNTLDGGAISGKIGGSSSNGGVQVSTSDGGAKPGEIGVSSNSVGVVQASASLVVQQSSIADGRRNSEKNDGDPKKFLGQTTVVASGKNKSAGVHGGKMASSAAVAAGVQSDSVRQVHPPNPSSGGGPPQAYTQADGKGLSQSGLAVIAPSVGTGPSGGGELIENGNLV